ncbi:MAG: zinc-ribbon domain-containing protein [Bacteroidota bacterium]|nr:zinc-ribbon domain-containing protein [Bacteroidota bacterium]
MAYCIKCSKQNPDTAKFCTGCGATLIIANTESIGSAKTTNYSTAPGKKNIWVILTIAAFIVVGALSWFLFFKKKNKTEKQITDTATVATPENSSGNTTAPSKIKSVTLRFKDFSFGDLPHYTFTDVNTGEDIELVLDETSKSNWEPVWNELQSKCGDEELHCPFKGQLYKAEMEYKLIDEYDWTGESLEKTGKKIEAWVTTSFSKTANNPGTLISYLDNDGKLVYQSDCFVIITGSFAEKKYARDYVTTMRNDGHNNGGYLWIPDYPSLSGKRFYATFIGPYQSYTECENNLRTLRTNSRFWYGKKVSYNPEQIEIRIK